MAGPFSPPVLSPFPRRRRDFQHFFQRGESHRHFHGAADPERLHAFLVGLLAQGGQYFADNRLTVADLKVFVDVRGLKLWAKGQPVSAALQQRLLERKLMNPLEACLMAEDGVTPFYLSEQLAALLASQYGADWAARFRHFPLQPLAAASIGQVHRARLVDGRADYVSCFGSGTVREDIQKKSGNKFAVESCHIKIKDSDVSAHIWRFLYDTARQYRESFDVSGSIRSFEWQQVENEEPVIHTKSTPEKPLQEPEIARRVKVPDYARLLPEPIRKFTMPAAIADADHLSFLQGGGHGGSHPHLAHEFAMALVEGRDPFPNAKQSANWTCVGLCAHESALKGGAIVKLPAFTQ